MSKYPNQPLRKSQCNYLFPFKQVEGLFSTFFNFIYTQKFIANFAKHNCQQFLEISKIKSLQFSKEAIVLHLDPILRVKCRLTSLIRSPQKQHGFIFFYIQVFLLFFQIFSNIYHNSWGYFNADLVIQLEFYFCQQAFLFLFLFFIQ